MSDKELDELTKTFTELAEEARLSKQKIQAANAKRLLEKFKAVYQDFISSPQRTDDFMVWAAAKDAIEKNRYGLSTTELLTLGMSLIDAGQLGLKMAGVELAAESTQNELSGTSNRSSNSLKAIFNLRTNKYSQELSYAEGLVAEFQKSIVSLFSSVADIPMALPSDEVMSALKAAKSSCAKRELDSWLLREMKDIGNRLSAECDELMKNVKLHGTIDDAIDDICNEHRRKSSVELNRSSYFSHSICYFAYGMALKFSDRAEMEGAPQWTLPGTVASAASSLISNGLNESEVVYYRHRFFDTLFDVNPMKSADDSRTWVQAGATSMDRFCRSQSNRFLEDFTKISLIFAN